MSFHERVTTQFWLKREDKSERGWFLIVQKIDVKGRTRVLNLECRPASTYDKDKRLRGRSPFPMSSWTSLRVSCFVLRTESNVDCSAAEMKS